MENETPNYNEDAGESTPVIQINESLIGLVEFNVIKEYPQEELDKKIQKEVTYLLTGANDSAG